MRSHLLTCTSEASTTTFSEESSTKTASRLISGVLKMQSCASKTLRNDSSSSPAVGNGRSRLQKVSRNRQRHQSNLPPPLPSLDPVLLQGLQDPWTSTELRKRVCAGIVVSNTCLDISVLQNRGHRTPTRPRAE